MFRLSTITLRLFVLLILLISSIFGAIYLLSVPLIKNNVFTLELNSNRQVLNVVYDLASSISFNSNTYLDRTLNHHEQRLKSIVELSEHYIESAVINGRQKGRSDAEIWQDIFFSLRHFKFGFEGYVWISDYDAKILAHPSPLFHDTDMSLYIDVNGERVIPKLVALALKEGEGFYNYKWSRLDETQVIDKYSFVKNMPQWGLVIGAGVYIDDIEKEIAAQKEKAVKDIADVLKDIKISNNGYLYVFDSKGNMLFHPNANINGINFKTQLNPVTGNPIYKDLMAMADTGEELYYKWDRPDDPGHYNYEKLSLTRHLSGFDWYISSSVYFDDLMFSSIQLSQRIVAIGVVGLLVGALVAFLFAKWITSPIRKLSLTAQKINKGDLMAKTGIKRNDELGVLAESFDYMVSRLRNNIHTLNLRVAERTQGLSESNQQLLGAVQRLELTQSELRATEARQRLILNALPAQVAYLDSDLNFVFANREYLEIFNETKDSIVGKRISSVVEADMYAAIHPHIERALQGERVIYEYPLIDKGKPILTRRTVLPFYDESKKVVGLLTLSIDITKERETEIRLAEASKMKTVGQLSGGLAHDFNNLLTIILGNLLALQHQDAVPEAWEHHLAPAIRATRRGADLTRRLLAFSRRQPLSPSYLEPQSLVHDVVALISAPLPDHIILVTQVTDHCPAIYVDSALMEDALVNLLLNSADAMPKGGRLLLSVNKVNGAKLDSRDTFDEPIFPGQYVLFSIQDSGTGFTPEALIRACEPFYTTKLSGAGSGLGLSMVFGFVKQSKGYMRVTNNDDTGACVEVLLPATDGVKDMAKYALPSTTRRTKKPNNALVLLIEDNQDVRSVVREQLLGLGYAVIEASTADEAMGLLNVGLPSLVGVVSDGVMPGKASCYDVFSLVQEKFTTAFFVLMTGYSDQLIQTEYNGVLLQKPFDSTALAGAIEANFTGYLTDNFTGNFTDNSGHKHD
ncbi:cache domain-containing protein [Marinomonas sp. IMCC 4694]|uniref:cache domain-containing protein n=1 Tax=Marinomonas sp. IMCC 4694 TaxID=2605432 RepID=UPI0011E644A0|nr:cache domain-containing protein [Marinomonas sp. IMCC 4694]TYL47469.1 PAS domain-containing protein [Marinomonas sp. IMCC 4694]